jgi:hypothetical protein
MMVALDYYYDPVPDWRFCERCHSRPARWAWLIGTDAPMGVYCSKCLPPGGIAHRYLPAENGYIDLYNNQRLHAGRENRRSQPGVEARVIVYIRQYRKSHRM